MAFILGLLPQLLGLLAGFFGWLRERAMLNAGRAQERLDSFEKAMKEIADANAARDDVRRSDAAVDDPRLHDDGFRRDP